MDSSAEYYPYVFRVLQLPVEFAQVAFDLASRRVEAEAGSGRATRWGRLELAAAARDTPAGYAPWRRAAGTLRAGRRLWPRVPVELALLPWSTTRSEFGLTALTRRWPPPGPQRQRAYLEAATEALDLLAAAVDEACSHWAGRATPPPVVAPVPTAARR